MLAQKHFFDVVLFRRQTQTRIDVYETLCPQQMLVNKGGKIRNRVDVIEELKFLGKFTKK